MPLSSSKQDLKKICQQKSIGFGTYSISGAYSSKADNTVLKDILTTLMNKSIADFRIIDTARLYGSQLGENEQQLGKFLKELVVQKQKFHIHTKCGIEIEDNSFIITNDPQKIKESCMKSLENLTVEYIDVFYLHRLEADVTHLSSQKLKDKFSPIVDILGELIEEGKIRGIGLSEANENCIRAFYDLLKEKGKEDYFVALQCEYSLVNQNTYKALRPLCNELGLIFFAYSPINKGYLTDFALENPDEIFTASRATYSDQFSSENKDRNIVLLKKIKEIAEQVPCSIEEMALAFLIREEPNIVIPLVSVSTVEHLEKILDLSKIKFQLWEDFVTSYKSTVAKYIKLAKSNGSLSEGATATIKTESVEIFYPELQTGDGLVF